jgi:hypothetical protein
MKGSVLDSEATIYICSWSINFSAREKLLLKLLLKLHLYIFASVAL